MRILSAAVVLLLTTLSIAQPQQPPPPPHRQGGPGGLQMGPPGMWWLDQDVVRLLKITPEQQNKMSDIFQANRTKMIDLKATLDKEEVTLEPLMKADVPEDAKILAQIDRVAAARAELDKNHAKMLLAMRHVLTPEQWKVLQAEDHGGPRDGGPRGGPRGGPDGAGPGGPPPPRRPEEL